MKFTMKILSLKSLSERDYNDDKNNVFLLLKFFLENDIKEIKPSDLIYQDMLYNRNNDNYRYDRGCTNALYIERMFYIDDTGSMIKYLDRTALIVPTFNYNETLNIEKYINKEGTYIKLFNRISIYNSIRLARTSVEEIEYNEI